MREPADSDLLITNKVRGLRAVSQTYLPIHTSPSTPAGLTRSPIQVMFGRQRIIYDPVEDPGRNCVAG
ncbi:hypothetical protein BN2475_190191 [Paraburkholderia ribeironis]|uniref:Uncharacterized protein n=1 Tax=Paraburkholderia ribeironis TaxID=1247936 RepID=A0A1N7RW60_9BURK|nr:hypothetical protein BN2475_190191 [Paraburkholderia ribeironis]